MTGALRRLEAPGRELLGERVEGFLAGLGGPTLLHIPGRDRSRVRAVATLLHGNEPSGVRALHAWLRHGAHPAVDALCFVGAVEAALRAPGFAHRMLPGRRDLNRCFAPPFDGFEGAVASELLAALRAARCEAIVDLHNNTGHNPPYGVATGVERTRLALASLFADRVVHSDLRLGTLTEATEDDAPGVTIECGRAGDPAADAAALAGLERYLSAERLPTRPVGRVSVLERPIRVSLRAGARVAFGESPVAGVDLTVPGDIDRHNFCNLGPGVRVGWVRDAGAWPIEARGADGSDVSRDFFDLRGGALETRRDLVAIMMTTDPAVAESDCLFYVVSPRAERPGEGGD